MPLNKPNQIFNNEKENMNIWTDGSSSSSRRTCIIIIIISSSSSSSSCSYDLLSLSYKSM